MALREPRPPPVDPKELAGTVWEQFLRPRLEAPSRRTGLIDVVPLQRQTLDPGAGFDIEVAGDFCVQELVVDVAPDVDATVWLDDEPRFQTRDRLGLGGSLRLGDGTGRSHFALRKIRIQAANLHPSNKRDVRAWMVVA